MALHNVPVVIRPDDLEVLIAATCPHNNARQIELFLACADEAAAPYNAGSVYAVYARKYLTSVTPLDATIIPVPEYAKTEEEFERCVRDMKLPAWINTVQNIGAYVQNIREFGCRSVETVDPDSVLLHGDTEKSKRTSPFPGKIFAETAQNATLQTIGQTYTKAHALMVEKALHAEKVKLRGMQKRDAVPVVK